MNWVLAGQTNMLGRRLATGLTSRPGAPAPPAFTPASLFAAGEQGVWYDPSDLTTMFEDSAGTTPVHIPGNGTADSPVGKILDKSGRGNHATQSTSTARPTLSAKYNLFLYSEQFDNSYWYQTGGATLTANQAIAPDGTNTAELMTITAGNVYVFNNGSQPSTTANVIYKMTSYFKQGTARYAYPVIAATSSVRYGSLVDLQTGVLVTEKTIGTPSNTSCTITDAGNGWWRITQTCSASSSGSGYGIFACTNNSAITVDGNNNILNATIGSTAYIWGADFRVSNDSVGLPVYQRVVDANTYDSTGFPYYLNADGVDDYLRVSSLNMTSTNKVGVFTAIRVLIDTDTQLIHDFNNSNPGQFVCYYKNPTLGSTLFYGGTAQSNLNSNSAWSIPAGKVLTFTGDISAPLGVIRENGTQVASSAGSVGTGNFGNGILDIFARGAALNLKGRMYGHIFRGAESTATEISNTENWLNGKGKIY